MFQGLPCWYPPVRVQTHHLDQISKVDIQVMPPSKRLPWLPRSKVTVQGNKTFEEQVFSPHMPRKVLEPFLGKV